MLVDYSSENMHDMFTQRYSKGKTGWSIMMLKCLRELFSLLYTPEYGLLVDLHVLLDMAGKTCCDDEVLLDWALEVGVDRRVLEFYLKYREQLYYGLECGREQCSTRDAVRLIRGFPDPSWLAVHGERVKRVVEKHHPVVLLVAAILGVIPGERGDSWEKTKKGFYREVNRYLRELGEENAELLKDIVTCKALQKAVCRLAEDLVHAGYATTREDGSIVIDWNTCNYILRLTLNEAKRYLEEWRRETSSAPPLSLENTLCNLLNVANGVQEHQ